MHSIAQFLPTPRAVLAVKPHVENDCQDRPRKKRHPREGADARIRPHITNDADIDQPLPRIGTLARSRRLLLAALRVWELKRGFRD